MQIEDVRGALHRQPFKPFTLRLSDGRALPIPHPDFVALTKQVVIVVTDDNSWAEVDPFMVVSLDYNGAAKRGKH